VDENPLMGASLNDRGRREREQEWLEEREKMPRYMPQDVFDSLVVLNLLADCCEHDTDAPIERYLKLYPSEERGRLKSDIHTASRLNRRAGEKFLKLAAPGLVDSKHDRLGFINETERRRYVFFALQQISATMEKRARAKTPLLRRILGGTVFNYETQPQTGRINRCRANIAMAEQTIVDEIRSSGSKA
jgi:hypothetical protein